MSDPPGVSTLSMMSTCFRILLIIGGSVLLLVPPTLTHYHTPAGFLLSTALWPMTLGAAGLLMALLWPTRYRRAGFWTLVMVTGHASLLQLVQAGSAVRYQHLSRIGEWGWPSTVLVLETVLVLGNIRGVRRAWRSTGVTMTRWKTGVFLVILSLATTTLSRDPARYVEELATATVVLAVQVGIALLIMEAWPEGAPGWWRRFGASLVPPGRDGGFDPVPAIAAAWAFVVAALLNLISYQRHPHVPDEVVYLIQAKYLAAGRLFMSAPPVPRGFDIDLMTMEPTRWYSPVPPGWPAVLALGERLGVPSLVNPILTALAVLVTYVLVRRLYGKRIARYSAVLLATSPWFLFIGMSYMNHQLALVTALTGAYAVLRWRQGSSGAWLVVGGIMIGIVGINRPLEGLVVALLLGLWCLIQHGTSWTRRVTATTLLAGVTAITAASVLPYNALLTGDPLTFPIMAYTDAVYGEGHNALGFGPDKGLGWSEFDPFPGHDIKDAVINSNLNLTALNVELTGWPTGSLLLIVLLVLGLPMRREDGWMLLAVGAVVVAHAFYWFAGGPDFGARYWYLTIVPLVILNARGLEELSRSSTSRTVPAKGLAGVLILSAVTVFVPWRALNKYRHFRGMRPDLRAVVNDPGFRNSLLLVHGDRHPDWSSAAVYNPVDLESSAPVFAWDRSPEVRRDLVAAFPDREVWLIDGPSVTGSGYVIRAGPLVGQAATASWPSSPGTAQ